MSGERPLCKFRQRIAGGAGTPEFSALKSYKANIQPSPMHCASIRRLWSSNLIWLAGRGWRLMRQLRCVNRLTSLRFATTGSVASRGGGSESLALLLLLFIRMAVPENRVSLVRRRGQREATPLFLRGLEICSCGGV